MTSILFSIFSVPNKGNQTIFVCLSLAYLACYFQVSEFHSFLWLHNGPLQLQSTFCSSTHLLTDMQTALTFWLL